MLTWHFWNSNLNGTPVGKLKNHMRIWNTHSDLIYKQKLFFRFIKKVMYTAYNID
jgi:hypothetical protein